MTLIALGKFWGIVCFILSIACFIRFIVNRFYHSFIRGLSKRRNRKLIDVSTKVMKGINKNHTLLGAGALISLVIHINIMYKIIGFKFSGFLAALALLFTIAVGIINRFMYKDKSGKFTQYHVIASIVVLILIILHVNLV